MKVTLLGTGTSQGVPVIGCKCEACISTDSRDKRLRTAAMVEFNDKTIIIDIGPDFRQQMLRANVKKVDAILVTHEHTDHMIGLDDVRPFNFRYRMDMPVYAEQRVLNNISERFAYIFAPNPYPGAPRVLLHPISKNESFELFGQSIVPIEVLHYKLPVLGFRFGPFTYITDIKTISKEEIEKVKGTEYLVVSALRKEDHISHFTLDEALDFIKEINPKQAYLTHLSHRMGTQTSIEKLLPENVSVGYDGLEILMIE